MAEKRPLNSGQNVDTCAVCKHCSTLCKNLNNCDRCGAPLEKDNTAVCYSSESNKRPRLENGTSNNGLRVNGENSARTPNTMNPSNQPVPQALYMNTSNIPTAPGAPAGVRPQALYVNMNNMNSVYTGMQNSSQNFPVSVASSQLSSLASSLSRGMQSTMPGSIMPGSIMTGSSMFPSNQVPVGTMQGARAPPPYTNPNQPARPPSQPMQQPAQAQQAASAVRPQQPQSSSSPGPNRNAALNKVHIVASQIRIGLRKFTPSASVVFKQEGVMFTLKEYPNAPLLLNARAIVKCKANMTQLYPAFFFYLESSCVKQIRSIFGMREWEFSEKSQVDKVRCISIFPAQISSKEARIIQETFLYMKNKYQRQDALLENCTPSDILDIFYGTTDSEAPAAATTAQTTNNTTQNSSRSASTRNDTTATQSSTNTNTTTAASSAQGQYSVTPVQAGTNPPTIVIPEDATRWQEMQKNLVRGGVYHLQTQNGQKKYCLWNGTTLVSCLVHDSEVQLQCTDVRIGSLRAPAVDFVRVVNDKTKQEIFFKYKGPDGTVQITISLLEVVECLVVCHERLKALFIYGNPSCCSRIRSTCRMGTSSHSDPYYNVTSKEERQKHLILYLKDINSDQKEALLKMKNENSNSSIFKEIDLMKALKTLSDIQANSISQSKIDDYFRRGGAVRDIENQLLQDSSLQDKTATKAPARSSTHPDDDDDDVIMTQEEIGIKCPYTQQIMQDPIRNRRCGHNYEKVAIMEFISRKKLKNIEAKCPYAGCGNTVPLRMEDLEENNALREYIQKHKS